MPHQIDRAKTAAQNLLELVNTGSTYPFMGTEFTNGNPSVYTPESPDTSNTEITLTAVSGSGFTGTKTVRYRRLEMGQTKTAAATEFSVTDEDDIDSIKAQIAIEHNLVLSEFNLVGDLPIPGGADTNCTLQAVSNSVLYFGESGTITLLAPDAPPPSNYSVRMQTVLEDMIHASAYTTAVADVVGRGGTFDASSAGPGITLSELDMLVTSSGSTASCTGTENSLVPNGIVCEWEVVASAETQMSVGFLSGSGSYSNSDFRAGDDNFPGPFGTWYDSDGQGVAAGQSGLTLPTYTTGDVIGIINRSGVGTLFFKNGVQVLATGNQLNNPRAVVSFQAA
jgi:hypothetical protein